MMAIYLIKFHVVFNLDIYQWTKSPRDTTFAIDISPSFGFGQKRLTILAANVDAVCVDAFDPPVSFRK